MVKPRNLYGGEVIGAGGYGCVFKPALRCQNSNKRIDGVSKLSIANYSNIEWKKITVVKQYIKTIPNYQNYFLLAYDTCQPAKLDNNDKKNFDTCKILEEWGYTSNNINDKLADLQIINMPYGGINLDKLFNYLSRVFFYN